MTLTLVHRAEHWYIDHEYIHLTTSNMDIEVLIGKTFDADLCVILGMAPTSLSKLEGSLV